MQSTFYFLDESFWTSPVELLLFLLGMFLVVYGRYLIFSAGYHYLVSKIARKTKRGFLRSGPSQWKKEITWSACSAFVFAALTILTVWLYQEGWTKIYTDAAIYGMPYFFFSIGILLIGYETYYYWLHRWMHIPSVYKKIHSIHHASIHTSVFTSFAIHPLEAVLQFIFLPLISMILPFHYLAIATVLIVMTVSAVINHGAFEIFPKSFLLKAPGKFMIGATHHDLHHKEFKTNFGLYFTFWDKWMKTESPNLPSRLEEVTSNGDDLNLSR